MTAEEILRINKPEQLFPDDALEAKQRYHDLVKAWHPDVNHHAYAHHVFKHVHDLFKLAETKLEEGSWGYQGRLVLPQYGMDNGGWSLRYHSKSDFELGEQYVGDHSVVYVVSDNTKSFVDNLDNFEKISKSFRYASAKMESECKRYLPHQVETMVAKGGRRGLAVRNKTEDLLLLRDVSDHFEEGIDPKHVAWILSSLHNLSCYLSYAGLAHQNISMDTYYVSPQHHSGALLGGWWYAARFGDRLTSLPSRTVAHLPWRVRHEKQASHTTDLELIRLVGRELLGDPSGKNMRPDVPKPMAAWLREVVPEKDDAVSNYRDWIEVLETSFGARRFTVMDLDHKTLYQ
jgi:hypothetical protein